MSKEYIREDGSHVTVTDDNFVFDSNGCIGQINQFGEFVPNNGSESYRIFGNGNIVGSNGSSGNITHGKYIKMENSQNEDSVMPTSSGETITIPLWVKLLLAFVVLPILGSVSIFSIAFLAASTLLYEEFQKGNPLPLIVFLIFIIAIIVLSIFVIRRIIKIFKKKQ